MVRIPSSPPREGSSSTNTAAPAATVCAMMRMSARLCASLGARSAGGRPCASRPAAVLELVGGELDHVLVLAECLPGQHARAKCPGRSCRRVSAGPARRAHHGEQQLGAGEDFHRPEGVSHCGGACCRTHEQCANSVASGLLNWPGTAREIGHAGEHRARARRRRGAVGVRPAVRPRPEGAKRRAHCDRGPRILI